MKKRNNAKRVVVAMSGGVDSSVVAYLLKKQGYEVIGVFLKFWVPGSCKHVNNKTKKQEDEYIKSLGDTRENACCDMRALMLAKQVAGQLNIPIYTVNVSTYFKKEIVDSFISEYESGRTPNPCVICNEKIKFGVLWKKARSLGADFLATGHYVKAKQINEYMNKGLNECLEKDNHLIINSFNHALYRSKDVNKDQTYFLSGIDPAVIPHLMFPLGNMEKKDVREIARKAKLPVYNKKDSTGICFIPDGDTSAFLSFYSKKLNKPGDIVDKYGNKLGRHRGLMGYTVGEKIGDNTVAISFQKMHEQMNKGLNELRGNNHLIIQSFNHLKSNVPRIYVTSINIKKNQLVVGLNANCFTDTLIAKNVNVLDSALFTEKTILAQIRGGHSPERARIVPGISNIQYPISNKNKNQKLGKLAKNSRQLAIEFQNPVRAATPGQTVAFYTLKGKLLGGGIII